MVSVSKGGPEESNENRLMALPKKKSADTFAK